MPEPSSSIPQTSIPTSTLEYYQTLPEPEGAPPRERYWLHALLLLATCFTTLIMGARMQFNFEHNRPALSINDESIPYFPASWMVSHPDRVVAGWPFAFTVMLFFLAHEMGHYVCCRRYGISATLPFFIPMATPIGTMGAVILIRSRIRSRTQLFDIGIAGPIAGFVVALGILILSIGWAKPAPRGLAPDLEIGFPLIFTYLQKGLALVNPHSVTAGLPMRRVLLHPASIAAWVGMYATALNLLPSGQLDGGHIIYGLAPRAHRVISWLTVAVLVCLGKFNYGWWFWAGIIVVMNIFTFRQQQAPEYPALPTNRWTLGVLGAAMLMVTFTISPFQAN